MPKDRLEPRGRSGGQLQQQAPGRQQQQQQPELQPIQCSKAAADPRCAGGLYAAALERTGQRAAVEQAAHWEACGYGRQAAEAAGQAYLQAHTRGTVGEDSRRPGALATRTLLDACLRGLPRGLGRARANELVARMQVRQAAAAAGSWGRGPLLLAAALLAPPALASAYWLWGLAGRTVRRRLSWQ